MKKETNVILYPAGAYGNFINWCYSYFAGKIKSINLPMNESGSVHHAFPDANRFIISDHQLQDYLKSDENYSIIQIHESTIAKDSKIDLLSDNWFELFSNDLSYLSDTFKSIVYIYPTTTSLSWILNNSFYKVQPFIDCPNLGISNTEEFLKKNNQSDYEIELLRYTGVDRLKLILDTELDISTFSQWGHSCIDEFDPWELRELCSTYFYDRSCKKLLSDEQISILIAKFKNIKFVKLDSLRNEFSDTISSIMQFFNVSTSEEELSAIYSQWIVKQHHINKDKLINDIVEYSINGKELTYSNLTFFDEIFIQRKLSDKGFELACYNLNSFPSNTKELTNLLIKYE
jgi:hypothetical protein